MCISLVERHHLIDVSRYSYQQQQLLFFIPRGVVSSCIALVLKFLTSARPPRRRSAPFSDTTEKECPPRTIERKEQITILSMEKNLVSKHVMCVCVQLHCAESMACQGDYLRFRNSKQEIIALIDAVLLTDFNQVKTN